MNQSPNELTKRQEFLAAKTLASNPSIVWSNLVELARKDIAAPQRFSQDPAFFSQAIVCAAYLEFEMDKCRPEAKRLLADIRTEGVNPATIVAEIYRSLKSIDTWNPDIAPDIPDLFFSRQCGPQGHPMGTLRKCLCWLALGRVATEVIYHIHADSPLGTHFIAWLFKDDPPAVLEGEIRDWDTNTPSREIIEGYFPKYNWNLDDIIEDYKPVGDVDKVDKILAGQEGLVEAKETWSKKHISELLIAIQDEWLVKSLQATIRNEVAGERRQRKKATPSAQLENFLWQKLVRKYKPKTKAEREQLRVEFDRLKDRISRQMFWDSEKSKLEQDLGVLHGTYQDKPEIKLIRAIDGEGPPLDFLFKDKGLKGKRKPRKESETHSPDHAKALGIIKAKAGLTHRRSLVVDLTLSGKTEREIALEIARVFGKPTTEGNVRKILHDAKRKMQQVASELSPEELYMIRDLLS